MIILSFSVSASEIKVKLDSLPETMPAEYEKLSKTETYRILKEERDANIRKDEIIEDILAENKRLKSLKEINHGFGIKAVGGFNYNTIHHLWGVDLYAGVNYRRYFHVRLIRLYIHPYFEAEAYVKVYDDYGGAISLGFGFNY